MDRDTDTETEVVAMFLSLLIFFYEKNGLCWVYIGRVFTYFDAFLLIITMLLCYVIFMVCLVSSPTLAYDIFFPMVDESETT